jgi:hypothetical protein
MFTQSWSIQRQWRLAVRGSRDTYTTYWIRPGESQMSRRGLDLVAEDTN